MYYMNKWIIDEVVVWEKDDVVAMYIDPDTW
jgi:hypothetical protein